MRIPHSDDLIRILSEWTEQHILRHTPSASPTMHFVAYGRTPKYTPVSICRPTCLLYTVYTRTFRETVVKQRAMPFL